MQDENKNTHEQKINAVLKKLFPELVFRMEFLERLKKSWPLVSGKSLAKFTRPFDIRGGVLYISADNPHAAQMLTNMKGNIKRACSRLNLSGIKIIQNRHENQRAIKNSEPVTKSAHIEISDNEINGVIDKNLNDINPEAANAIARLKVFFEKRFAKK